LYYLYNNSKGTNFVQVDVAIVGASSSGLYAAAKLAHAGRRVAVFERRKDSAPERRTLIITPHLARLMPDMPAEAVLHQTSVMSVVTPNAHCNITLHEADLIIERGQMTRALEQRARAAGAQIFCGHRFRALHPDPDGVALTLDTAAGTRQVCARALIGADGITSAVARAVQLPLPPTVPIIQAEVALPPGWNPNVTRVWFDTEGTRFFYWLIPESATHGVAGLIGDDSNAITALLDRFLAQHDLHPLAYQASRVALYHPGLKPQAHVGTAPVLLIGDAAGQVKVTTVGGSVTGFWGAEAAVRSLLHGTSYAAALRPLHAELALHWWLRLLIERLDNAGYDQLVHHVTHPVRQFLSRYNRDQMARHIWQLLFLQPRFVPLLLRLLQSRRARTGGSMPAAPQPAPYDIVGEQV
jgi:flavin-dependent dehydrogenase